MIYLLLCIIIIIFSFTESINHSSKNSQFLGIFITISLILFAGLRYKTGTDWPSYVDFYNHVNDSFEPGYMFLNDLFSDNGINYNIFLLFINSLSLILVYFALRKNAKLLVVSLLLFYCELYLYFNFSGMRQGLAISFTLFSIKYAVDRKLIKFIICAALAMSFHITAGIFLVAYFIPKEKLKLKHYILITTFFLFLSTIIFSLLNFVSGDLASKIKFYTELQEQVDNIKALFVIGILKRSIIIIVVLVFGRKLLAYNKFPYYFNVYLFGFGMYLSTYLISPDIGVRLSSYFLIFDIILAGNLIYYNRNIYIRLILVTVFSLTALYKISTYMKIETYDYQSILTVK